MKALKPECPNKKHYFVLSRKLNSQWLIYHEYRELIWYWEHYERIQNHWKFEPERIKEIKNKDLYSKKTTW